MLISRALSALALLAASLVVGVATSAPAEGSLNAARATHFCHGEPATIVGRRGSDVLKGTPGDDVIVARGGSDVIWAGAGDDVVCAGEGRDVLMGGRGDDLLLGQGDQFFVDDVGEGPPHAQIQGDTISPGPGRDRVVGGYDPRQARLADAFPDIVDYRGTSHRVEVRLAGPGGVGIVTGQGRDLVVGQPAQGVFGSPLDDRLIGSSSREVLHGGSGEDVIRGRGGDDTIHDLDGSGSTDPDVLAGGAGDDEVFSRYGVDRVLGGSGDDRLWVAPACHTVLPGTGVDWLWLSNFQTGGANLSFTFDAAAGQVQRPRGSAPCGRFGAFDRYFLEGETAPITFLGTEGPDVLDAQGDGVTAHLLGGDDDARGTSTDDLFLAGDGTDTVDAREGQDVCVDTEAPTSCESSTAP